MSSPELRELQQEASTHLPVVAVLGSFCLRPLGEVRSLFADPETKALWTQSECEAIRWDFYCDRNGK